MDNRFEYENSMSGKNEAAKSAQYAQSTADTAKNRLERENELNKAVDAAGKRTEEYTTKATAANLSAANDTRDAVEGKDWPGRTKAKFDEFGQNIKAKGQEAMNDARDTFSGTDTRSASEKFADSAPDRNSHITDPTLKEKMDFKDEDFGDKVKDVAHNAGDKVEEGFDKVKGWFGKDDSQPRVK